MDPNNAPSPETANSAVPPSDAETGTDIAVSMPPASSATPSASASAAESTEPPEQQAKVQPQETVQQARSSITALTSLFDDPVTLKARETLGSNGDQAASTPTGTAKAVQTSDESLADAMLTGPRRSKPTAHATQAQIAQALDQANAAAAKASEEANSAPNHDAHSTTENPTADSEDKTAPSAEDASSQQTSPQKQPKPLSPDQQVRIKRHDDHLTLIFPPETKAANPDVTVDFVDSELWQQLQQRLSGGERSWKLNTPVHLNAQNHLLDSRQLQEMSEALDRYDLKLTRVATSRRQTAVAAATAGFSIDQGAELPLVSLTGEEEKTKDPSLAVEPLYLQTTVRSGVEIRHPGSVIIMGDLNPGSSVVANGDILVWGRLRGVAHAGAAGNRSSIILALKMEPTQLRIGEAVARVPEAAAGPMIPEVAYVTAKKDIRITEAASFTRPR